MKREFSEYFNTPPKLREFSAQMNFMYKIIMIVILNYNEKQPRVKQYNY